MANSPAPPCLFEDCDKRNFARGYCAGHAAQIRKGVPLQPLRQPRPEPTDGYVWCCTCKQYQAEENFTWDKVRGEPARSCNPCRAAAMRIYNKANSRKIARRVTLAKWGLTEEQYDAMFEAQGHVCAICSSPPRSYRTLSIDHCHATGKIRGLLCQDCNLALGQFKDQPELLDRAAAYLRSGGVTPAT